MKKMILGSLFISSIILLAGCRQGNHEALQIDETKDAFISNSYSDLSESVDRSAEELDFQGSILIAYKDKIILAKGYGYANKSKQLMNTMNTTYEIGSLTKQMTAAAIMQLSESGKLSVDDTIDQYFPDYIYGEKITIKNLLQMRSGIIDYANDTRNFFNEDFLNRFKTEKEFHEAHFDPKDFLDNLYSLELKFEPDSKFEYSNSNYFLLGLIIEQVTGISYREYIQENIFKPCNMNSSNMEFKQTAAKGYSSNGYVSYHPSLIFSAGSICSNVVDLYKWDEALIKGQVVSETSFQEMINVENGYGYGIGNFDHVLKHKGKTFCFESSNKIDLNNNIIIAMTNKLFYFDDFLEEVEKSTYDALLNNE